MFGWNSYFSFPPPRPLAGLLVLSTKSTSNMQKLATNYERNGEWARESQVRFYSRQRRKGGTQKTGGTETKLIIGSMQTVQAGRQQSSRLNNTNHITSLTPLLSTLLALLFSLLTDASTCSSLAAVCAGWPASGLAGEAAGARRSNLKLLLRYTALSLQKDLLVLFHLKQLS